ncbi:hypothetical protein EVAR_67235_1 [Eumeta japonica]|uniref:Uncharacterized protein n=1 Tax=Eumeta variegata TaxID=151549 RepID=A0A4C1YPV4_EUMVA|nr:hypothetical protein EVAR_67235_1 [Eumeta japonica]
MYDEDISWPTWLQHKTGPARPEKYHTVTEYRQTANAPVTPLALRLSMGGDDYLLSDDSPARLHLDYG